MKRIIMASITAVVVIAVLAGTLIPILDDATTTHETFTNTGIYYMESPIAEDVTLVYEFDSTDGWTVNAEELTSYNNTNIIITDNTLIRTSSTNTVQLRGDVDMDITSGTFTVTSEGVAYDVVKTNTQTVTGTITYDYIYCAVTESADYILSRSTADINYMQSDSIIVGFGVTKVGSSYPVFKINGTLDAVTVTCLSEGITISNVAINKTAISGFEDLYDFDSVTFTATDESNNVTNATYNIVVIPSEVTAERSVHFTDGENAIFNAIPVLIIVALLLGVVALVLRSRMD